MPKRTIDFADEDRDERILNERTTQFLKRYRPEDPELAYYFEADLITLIRHSHALAAKPYQKLVESALRAMPPIRMDISKEEGK